MVSPFQALALEIRPQLDAESLVFELLQREYAANPQWSDVHIQAQINLRSNDYSDSGRLIVCSAGAPYQSSLPKAWVWRFPLTLSVIGSDSTKANDLARDLYRVVSAWPFADKVEAGAVNRVLSFTGFKQVSKFKENQGKSITEYAADLLVEAHDPYPR